MLFRKFCFNPCVSLFLLVHHSSSFSRSRHSNVGTCWSLSAWALLKTCSWPSVGYVSKDHRFTPTHDFFFCSNSNIGTWDNHVAVWSGMGGSTVNWTFQSHQPNKEMYFRDCRFSEKISKKELQNYDPRNTRSFRRLSCREVCRRQLITLCCHGTTLCFSVVIDRGSVLMSIFSGLCDVWRCTKSDTFITD